jgi:hypothetical protein
MQGYFVTLERKTDPEAYIIELQFYEGLLGVFCVCTSMQ